MIFFNQSTFNLILTFCVLRAYANDAFIDESTNKSSSSSPTVAIIGCGPSGIAFLHAINLRRKKMEQAGDFVGLSKLPIATCFEISSDPGGVWKAQRAHSHLAAETNHTITGKTNMYEALWTNGPKELFEYFDYTFEDHFNQSLPAFLPRELVLNYILKRVQRNEPDFFSHAKFNTEVEFVQFNDPMKKFEITIHDIALRERSTLHFDKCIWAAGWNGLRSIPRSVETVLQEGKFLGSMLHSSEAGDYLSDVKGKRILMIGDAYSAEDLTLQALKLGVKSVYILSRGWNGICCSVVSWPKGDVHILHDMILTDVTETGHGLRFTESTYNETTEEYEYISNGVTTNIEDISAVIYCTGYNMDMSMLDTSLKDAFKTYNKESFQLRKYLAIAGLPTNWKMSNNSLTELIGDVEPAEEIYSEYLGIYPGIYRGFLISNPNMMFMRENGDSPLFELDVQACLLLAHLIGDLDMPSMDNMELWNTEVVINGMQQPSSRYEMDMNYASVWNEEISGDDDRVDVLYHDSFRNIWRNIAQDIQDASFSVDIGTAEELNETGESILRMQHKDDSGRTDIHPKDSDWKTFRDNDPSSFVSLFTGQSAVPFQKHWIDMDEKVDKLDVIATDLFIGQSAVPSQKHWIEMDEKGLELDVVAAYANTSLCHERDMHVN